MRQIRGLGRLVRTLLHLLAGLFTILLKFPALAEAGRQQKVRHWSAGLLDCLAVRVELVGAAQCAGPLMLVANHVSWLDISVLQAAQFCRFVAKAELRRWPVIGLMAGRSGTLFIERESRRDAMRVVHHMADSLRAGEVLAVFPEGTTSDGTGLLPFHANLFQAAISSSARVQPVWIEYLDAHSGRPSQAPNFVGDEFFLASVWRTLCASGTLVRIHRGEAQSPLGRDRRKLAADLRDAVLALQRPAPAIPCDPM